VRIDIVISAFVALASAGPRDRFTAVIPLRVTTGDRSTDEAVAGGA